LKRTVLASGFFIARRADGYFYLSSREAHRLIFRFSLPPQAKF
jgi:hypothetical protein